MHPRMHAPWSLHAICVRPWRVVRGACGSARRRTQCVLITERQRPIPASWVWHRRGGRRGCTEHGGRCGSHAHCPLRHGGAHVERTESRPRVGFPHPAPQTRSCRVPQCQRVPTRKVHQVAPATCGTVDARRAGKGAAGRAPQLRMASGSRPIMHDDIHATATNRASSAATFGLWFAPYWTLAHDHSVRGFACLSELQVPQAGTRFSSVSAPYRSNGQT